MRHLPDEYSNPYPTREKLYIVVLKTVNSNKDLIEMYPNKVLLPCAGVSSEGTCDHRVGIFWGELKDHRCPPVK